MFKRRVVITGIGLITPIGNTIKTSWNNVINGNSGIDLINNFDTSKYTTKFAGLIKNFSCKNFIINKKIRHMDLFIQYGIVAAKKAIQDSGITINENNAHRFGVAIGSGMGGIGLIEKNYYLLYNKGPNKVSPFYIPSTMINMIAGNITIDCGFKGPTISISSACSSAMQNIGIASRIISYNDADVMLAGGSEKAITPLGLSGFCATKSLSKRNSNPKEASRPWDKDRDGFVLSDGAGMLVLEEYNHAKNRNANIYAEIVGFGMSNDAYHITSPPKYGEGASLAMFNALKDAKISSNQIQYINAHGTSTILGDIAEFHAIKYVFKNSLNLFVSSTKSVTGHLLGASGAVESIYSVLSLRDQIVPPTINLNNVDKNFDLDFIPNIARDVHNMKYVLCNSFGFGGTNASLIFKKI
ncbi:beta-ketoacyl-ACP synthase II [Enterobacteriaceae endosymbiont of Plateumaris consimilis]|uniref:beta-ketoacyl-ACP synthase II n=1 Tax=Enterobacteriaceae endosymbiont of Plateumaris consimilis TaxID=2675794 RepID=UPI0014496EEB|nr:beta-ketoacyl-ACP synthase II [Enterobacteriaceae endosymbiont of Plateumaris consimilis]QJC28501.1 beta-ketoacyl-ACP synthase II [Enterobacteriaceae endosymbiont of Plateumaris consimilis]